LHAEEEEGCEEEEDRNQEEEEVSLGSGRDGAALVAAPCFFPPQPSQARTLHSQTGAPH
jgi:hypothetical protein